MKGFRRVEESLRRGIAIARSRATTVVATLVGVVALGVVGISSLASPAPRPATDQLIDRYEHALVRHDVDGLKRLLAGDFEFHNLQLGLVQNRRGFLAWSKAIADSYPDFAVVIDDVTSRGNTVTVHFHGQPSTAAESAHGPTGVVVVERRGNVITAMWSNYSEFGLVAEM